LPDVPFRIVVPAATDYRSVNLEVWARLETGEKFLNLDFTPPRVQATSINAGLLMLLGASALGLALGLALDAGRGPAHHHCSR
jgi:hypothetical protein